MQHHLIAEALVILQSVCRPHKLQRAATGLLQYKVRVMIHWPDWDGRPASYSADL